MRWRQEEVIICIKSFIWRTSSCVDVRVFNTFNVSDAAVIVIDYGTLCILDVGRVAQSV